MYEHRREPVIPKPRFVYRLVRHFIYAGLLLLISLGIGVWGFCGLGHLAWIDAVEDSAMLLSGMGPVYCGQIQTVPGKLFASAYALFAGIVFYVAIGVILSPIIHRFLHKFHCDEEAAKQERANPSRRPDAD